MRQQIAGSAVSPVRTTEVGGEQDYLFTPDFCGFDGHFPDYPVFPAVLQILVAQQLAEQLLGRAVTGLVVERAKFMRQLLPEEKVTVSITLTSKPETVQVNATLITAEHVVAKFTLVINDGNEQ